MLVTVQFKNNSEPCDHSYYVSNSSAHLLIQNRKIICPGSWRALNEMPQKDVLLLLLKAYHDQEPDCLPFRGVWHCEKMIVSQTG